MINFKLSSFFIATSLSLSMCSTVQKNKVVNITHPNGLILTVPESVSTQQTSNGFLIKLIGEQQVRYSPSLEVSIHMNHKQPEGQWSQVRQINGRTIYFHVEKEAGSGSGGDTYTFSAWERYLNGYVFFKHIDQAEEPAEPDFSATWAIIEGTRVKLHTSRNR